jgi:hypothetical protein
MVLKKVQRTNSMGSELEYEAVHWWKYLNVTKKIKNKKEGKKNHYV